MALVREISNEITLKALKVKKKTEPVPIIKKI